MKPNLNKELIKEVFKPPFCVDKNCKHHSKKDKEDHGESWYRYLGHYYTKTFGYVPRYKCLNCGKTFSSQTFSLNYYLKMYLDYDEIVALLVNCCSLRAIGRLLKVRDSTVQNRIERIARQFLIVQEKLSENVVCKEDLVADGLESYTYSKFFPNNIHLLVGKKSRFIYFYNIVNLRRKGRMTEAQKKKRDEIDKTWRPEYKSLEKSFNEVLEQVLKLFKSSKTKNNTLFTDKKKEYGRAMQNNPEISELMESGKLKHNQTGSKLPRSIINPMSPINITERTARNDSANLKRKTICQSRDVNSGMYRFTAWVCYYNIIKRFKIDNAPMKQLSHAEEAGISKEVIKKSIDGLFEKRHFITHNQGLSKASLYLWFRMLETPTKVDNRYRQKYLMM